MNRPLLIVIALLALGHLLTGGEHSAAPAHIGFRNDFSDEDELDCRWRIHGVILGTRRTVFHVEPEASAVNGRIMSVEADCATGVMVSLPEVDLRKHPYMHWRWRVVRPIEAKSGQAEPDDQALVVYVGDGPGIRKRCLAYRWECFTPVGSKGMTRYAMGAVRVFHYCMRNRETPCGQWVEEERNLLEDFRAAYGTLPDLKFALSVGANSQHVKGNTRGEIDFIEFSDRPVMQRPAPAVPPPSPEPAPEPAR